MYEREARQVYLVDKGLTRVAKLARLWQVDGEHDLPVAVKGGESKPPALFLLLGGLLVG